MYYTSVRLISDGYLEVTPTAANANTNLSTQELMKYYADNQDLISYERLTTDDLKVIAHDGLFLNFRQKSNIMSAIGFKYYDKYQSCRFPHWPVWWLFNHRYTLSNYDVLDFVIYYRKTQIRALRVEFSSRQASRYEDEVLFV